MSRTFRALVQVAGSMAVSFFLTAGLVQAQTLVFNPGMVTSVAGNGSSSFATASYAGPATAAGLNFPRRIVIDASGNLYWMEKGGQVARVLASGKGAIPALPSVPSPTAGWVYTVAGNGTTTSTCATKTDAFGDGCPAVQASLNAPYGIAVDAKGNVYLGDAGDSMIRVVYAGGTIPGLPVSPVVGNAYPVAGTGTAGVTGDGGPAISAKIGASHGLAVDGRGNIYFADSGNQSVRVVYVSGTLPGIASPVAGNLYTLTGGATAGTCAKSTSTCGDGGAAIVAQINGPDSVNVDAAGNVYIGDTGDLRLRAIYVGGTLPGIANPLAGNIYTLAGNGVSGSGPDGVKATASSLTSGMGQPFIDAAGDIYVPDGTSNTVRKIDPGGIITTVLGGATTVCAAHTNAAGDGCAANAVTLNGVSGIVLDAAGNAYVADYKNNLIRLLTPGASALLLSGTVTQQTVTVSNGGTQPLQITGLTVTGPFIQAITGTTDCSASIALAAGASCQITVAETAVQIGTNTGSVAVASNALNGSSGINTIQLTAVVTQAGTASSLSISPALANVGQAVTFTATVNGPAGMTLVPTGTVTFLNGKTTIGSATLTAGKAVFRTSSLAVDSYSVTASYGGDTNFTGSVSSSAALTVSISPVPVVTLASSSTTPAAGQPVTLTSTVAAASGSMVPTGVVVFQDGATVLGQGTLNSAGVATLQVNSLSAGWNSLVAGYGGDATFVAADSPALVVTGTVGAQLSVFPGKLTTVAGSHTLGAGYSGDGQAATAAQIKTPLGLAEDVAGNLFFADSANNRIRRVDATTGLISTVAGTGTACAAASQPCGDGGLATAALLSGPQAVRVDAAGNLYILDKGDHVVRKVTATTGVITTVAGSLGVSGYAGDGAAATSAKLNGPRGLYLDNGGNLYIGDSGNAAVRRVDAVTGLIATVAGGGSTLGDHGPATSALLVGPRGMALDSADNLYIADFGAYRIRRVDGTTGLISTVAGTGSACTNAPCGDGGMATAAGLGGPQDVVVTAAGDLIFTDPNLNVVRRVSPAGLMSTIAGQQQATAGYTADGGASTSGLLSYPNSLLLDGRGNLYLSEANNSLVREALAGTTLLNFGSLTLGNTATQMATLASTGDQAVALSSITVPSGFSQQPSGTADCTAQMTLNAGTSCALDIQFAPLVPGTTTDSISIANNAGNAPNGMTVLQLTGSATGTPGKTAQTLVFAALSPATYGAAAVTLSASATSGLPVTFTVLGPAKLNGAVLSITGAGTVTVTASQTGDNTYAAATPVTQSFQVSPAVLTVTAVSVSRLFNAANPTFTFTLSGFVNGDTSSVVTGVPIFTTTATQQSAVGTYPITIGQGTLQAANYSFVFAAGLLTVMPIPADFTLSSNLPSLTLHRGVTGHLSLTLTPISNYKGSVTLSCGPLPTDVTCVFTPATLAADGSGSVVTGTLDIQTSGAMSSLVRPNATAGKSVMAVMPWLAGLLGGLLLLVRRRVAMRPLWLLLLFLGGLGVVNGCGAGTPYVAPSVTALTITGAAAGGGATHTINVTITVI